MYLYIKSILVSLPGNLHSECCLGQLREMQLTELIQGSIVPAVERPFGAEGGKDGGGEEAVRWLFLSLSWNEEAERMKRECRWKQKEVCRKKKKGPGFNFLRLLGVVFIYRCWALAYGFLYTWYDAVHIFCLFIVVVSGSAQLQKV